MWLKRENRSLTLSCVMALGMIGWLLTTDPPMPIVLAVIALLGVPLIGRAYYQGQSHGLQYGLDRTKAMLAETEDRVAPRPDGGRA
jgi:xanthosine utilization system XapX-like protein